jgi:thiamine-phosphate pyrophosphorylase
MAFDPALLPRPLICAVTNRRLFGASEDEACAALVEWSVAIAQAGVDLLQIREPDLSDATLASLTRAVLTATGGGGFRTILNDRTDVALATGAAGVHLPAAAPPAAAIRRLVGDRLIVGRSVHTGDDLTAVERDGGCDYLTFGTVFPSTSKPASHAAAGIPALTRACASIRLPVLAIGGVTVQSAAAAACAGAAGVAAIGLFAGPWLAGGSREDRAGRLADVVAAVRAGFGEAGKTRSSMSERKGVC